MSNENLEFMHNALKYLGFGEHTLLNQELEDRVHEGAPDFQLETEVSFDGESRISARLYYHRSKNSLTDRYYLNKWEARLVYPGKPEKEARKLFYIESSCRGVTFKQAFNLLQGRYVQRKVVDQNKEKHDWWLFLEPKMFGSDGYTYMRYIKYQFDLDKALDKYPIRELSSPEARERLCTSLRRGNLQQVTFLHENGKTEPRLLYANPDKRLIGNVSMAAGAKQKKGSTYAITELPEIDHPSGDAISESTLEEEPAQALKKAHL